MRTDAIVVVTPARYLTCACASRTQHQFSYYLRFQWGFERRRGLCGRDDDRSGKPKRSRLAQRKGGVFPRSIFAVTGRRGPVGRFLPQMPERPECRKSLPLSRKARGSENLRCRNQAERRACAAAERGEQAAIFTPPPHSQHPGRSSALRFSRDQPTGAAA